MAYPQAPIKMDLMCMELPQGVTAKLQGFTYRQKQGEGMEPIPGYQVDFDRICPVTSWQMCLLSWEHHFYCQCRWQNLLGKVWRATPTSYHQATTAQSQHRSPGPFSQQCGSELQEAFQRFIQTDPTRSHCLIITNADIGDAKTKTVPAKVSEHVSTSTTHQSYESWVTWHQQWGQTLCMLCTR